MVFAFTRWIDSYISYLSYDLCTISDTHSTSTNTCPNSTSTSTHSDNLCYSLVRGKKSYWGKDNGLWAGNWCDLCQ